LAEWIARYIKGRRRLGKEEDDDDEATVVCNI
jgi:hypothetical protein